MLPSDALAAMTADNSLGLMIDRRQFSEGRPFPAELELVAVVDPETAAQNIAVYLVRSNERFPDKVTGPGIGTHMRLMDRFFVPERCDSEVVRGMFDLIAQNYDSISAQSVNRAMARNLLTRVLDEAGRPCKVLDFGCGTGIAMQALDAADGTVTLLGVDLSANMLLHASARMECVMPMETWRSEPPPVDGAIACFVLHYDMPRCDLAAIARGLKPGAKFAGNFFKANPAAIDRLVAVLTEQGLELIERTHVQLTSSPDVILVFRKVR